MDGLYTTFTLIRLIRQEGTLVVLCASYSSFRLFIGERERAGLVGSTQFSLLSLDWQLATLPPGVCTTLCSLVHTGKEGMLLSPPIDMGVLLCLLHVNEALTSRGP